MLWIMSGTFIQFVLNIKTNSYYTLHFWFIIKEEKGFILRDIEKENSLDFIRL